MGAHMVDQHGVRKINVVYPKGSVRSYATYQNALVFNAALTYEPRENKILESQTDMRHRVN